MYFDRELQQWRPIPGGTQLGIPESNWSKPREMDIELKTEGGLKRFGKGLFQVMKDIGNSKEKRERDAEKRRNTLAGSISVPLGTSKHARR